MGRISYQAYCIAGPQNLVAEREKEAWYTVSNSSGARRIIVKAKTHKLTAQVKSALLALPNPGLLETLIQWLDQADENIDYLDWSDEYRFMLGYRIQSYETEAIYASFEELAEAEPDASISWIVPSVEMLRELITNLSVEDFYHRIVNWPGRRFLTRPTRRNGATLHHLLAMATILCAAWRFICTRSHSLCRRMATSFLSHRLHARENQHYPFTLVSQVGIASSPYECAATYFSICARDHAPLAMMTR